MKKFGLALALVGAFTGSAVAADMGPRAYSKAPAPMMAAPSWTGFYLFGGAGGGLWSADSNIQTIPGGSALTRDKRFGGSGWFGTAGAGFDWQLGNWVTGVFGDGQFGGIRGSLQDDMIGFPAPEGREKLRTSWAAGVRLGYLVAPNVLSYVNAGYSGSEWSGTNLTAGGRRRHHGFRDDAFFPSQRLVRWWRRREYPEYFRNCGTGLVHEDRISRGLLRPRRLG